MVWSKKKRLIPNQVALQLLNFASNFVKDAVRDMETHRGVKQRSGPERVTDELMCFCLFALDYGISNNVTAQKESQAIREALYYHWRQMLGDDDDGQAMWETSQQRLYEYAQVVNEEQTDEANKLVGLRIKLAECSDCPGHPRLVVLAPYLFRAATDAIDYVLKEGR